MPLELNEECPKFGCSWPAGAVPELINKYKQPLERGKIVENCWF